MDAVHEEIEHLLKESNTRNPRYFDFANTSQCYCAGEHYMFMGRKCLRKRNNLDFLCYRPPALSQTRLSRKTHLCRSDHSLPSLSPYMLLYFNLACVELGYDENSAVSK